MSLLNYVLEYIVFHQVIFMAMQDFYIHFLGFKKNINISKKLEKNILNQINNFYLDITNTIINDEVYDISLQGNRKNFLGGKEGVYTILDMVNRNDDSKNIFPFII